MRDFSTAEKTLLLLCVLPGEEAPITEARYRKLLRAAVALGAENPDMDAKLDFRELTHLGCSQQEAENILIRMERREALDVYLRNLAQENIQLVTRLSPEYPQRLLEKLGDRAPLALFCLGNLELLQRACISLVGSRKLREAPKQFAKAAGWAIGKQGYCYCSGGAAGADTEGFERARQADGDALLFLSDSLVRHRYDRRYFRSLKEGRLLLVSEFGPDQGFSNFRALSRNRLIHAMGQKVLVAQTTCGSGGTWQGTMENLKENWSPVFVYNGEKNDPGATGLLEAGAEPIGLEGLTALDFLTPSQSSVL